MKSLVIALALSATFSATANGTKPNEGGPTKLPIYTISFEEEGGPNSEVETSVRTYIENFHEGDFEEMREVLSNNFTNQGLNRDGSLTPVQKLDDIQGLMVGQEVVAPDAQNNEITITAINGEVASAELITGANGQRWKEHITLVRENGNWKVDKVFWSFL